MSRQADQGQGPWLVRRSEPRAAVVAVAGRPGVGIFYQGQQGAVAYPPPEWLAGRARPEFPIAESFEAGRVTRPAADDLGFRLGEVDDRCRFGSAVT